MNKKKKNVYTKTLSIKLKMIKLQWRNWAGAFSRFLATDIGVN